MIEFGIAEDFEGNKYHIKGILHSADGVLKVSNISQPISVTDKIKKGQRWYLLSKHNLDFVGIVPRCKLSKIEEVDKNTKVLYFKKYETKKVVKIEESKKNAFKKLLNASNLNKNNFEMLIRKMFSKVFILKDTKKILESDRVEFISDGSWIYLKCGDIAYRV